jgi:hypothetical protein
MKLPAAMLLALASGCLPAQTYVVGQDLDELEFRVWTTETGVHPSRDVLDDPMNPFAENGVGSETKWDILAEGEPPAAFYAWATTLAAIPTGENQLYTASLLHEIYERALCPDEELYFVHEMAIDAYQAVLDNFGDDLTYDSTGTIAYPVAPTAYNGILALGGVPEGGWILITNADGSTVLVQP